MVNNYQYKNYLSLGEHLLCGMGGCLMVSIPNQAELVDVATIFSKK
tara:strand:+ start:1016 stop:1153 length:138 start_codon:yes stop_codon:yes gene_type:complete